VQHGPGRNTVQHGATLPAEARSMQAALPRSNLVLLPDAGHLSNMEASDLFSSALSDFLDSPL
jgi:pimeloyl-ACP methyl ester carboxylesterase